MSKCHTRKKKTESIRAAWLEQLLWRDMENPLSQKADKGKVQRLCQCNCAGHMRGDMFLKRSPDRSGNLACQCPDVIRGEKRP